MPRKVFVAGEILTAADVNTNLMDQSVMVFDDASARTTAIPTPVEGMTTYLKDLDAVEFFDGSVFRRVGGLISVKSALFTGTQVATVAAQANVAVTDLSVTHALGNATNKLIISAFFGVAANDSGRAQVGIAVHDGTGLIAVGASPGGRTAVSAGGKISPTVQDEMVTMPSITFVHIPGDTTERTYTVRAINIDGAQRSVFINRQQRGDDGAGFSRGVSSLVIQEVAV